MKTAFFNFFLTSVIVVFFFSCKTRIENTLPEAENIPPAKIEKTQSTINLPIDIPIKALEEEINRQFQGLIYEDTSFNIPDKDDVMVKIWKTRNIKIQGYNEFIKYDVPLKIWANYRWKACDFCPSVEKETTFDIVVSFTSKLKVQPDWKFTTQTIPSGFTFETTPKLDFGIVSIPITAIVEPIVKEQLADVTKTIDKKVAANFDFSKQIDSIWRVMYVPQLVDSAYNAWLKITPVDVYLSPIRGNNERIKIVAGFKGLFEIIIGNKPENSEYKKLPQIKYNESPEKNFNFFLESFIDFESATKIARAHLKDTVLELTANKKVKIDDISFMGLGNKVYTRVDLSKSINGTIYFIGTPAYDKEKSLIYFKDFDYDLKTRNALFKSANWLLHGALKNKIEKEFNYSMADNLKASKKTISDLLTNYEYDNLFTFKGKLDQLDIYDIIVEETGLRIIINCSGKSEIKINSLKF